MEAPGGQPILAANAGDPGVRRLLERLRDWPGELVLTELAAAGDAGARARRGAPVAAGAGAGRWVTGTIIAAEPSLTRIEIRGLLADGPPLEVALPTVGRHNAANALGVAAAANVLGLDDSEIAAGLAGFAGVGRRLEHRGDAAGVAVYDDYGHHPTAIRVTIEALRQKAPGRRLWAIYEPLTFHRTAALLDQFAAALATADAVAIADIWAGRDRDTTVVTAGDLAAAVLEHRPGLISVAPGSVEATADWLAGQVRSGDVVLVMGGGRSYVIATRLLERLEAR